MDKLDQLAEWCRRTFWRKRDHVSESTGTASAGLPVVLDAGGKLDASLLDNADIQAAMSYATGTWTPGVSFGGGTVGIAYSNQVGRYVRIGNMIFARGYLSLTSKGSSTGDFNITGFPFPTNVTGNLFQAATIRAAGLAGVAGDLSCYAPTSATIAYIEFLSTGTRTVLNDTHCTNTSDFIINFTYEG